jgi:hypothetical protein
MSDISKEVIETFAGRANLLGDELKNLQQEAAAAGLTLLLSIAPYPAIGFGIFLGHGMTLTSAPVSIGMSQPPKS